MNKKNLDITAVARARQTQLNRIAETKNPEGCKYCGGTIFTTAYELRLVKALEIGAPTNVLCMHLQRHICVGCHTPWKLEEENVNGKTAGGERSEGGDGTPSEDGESKDS